ncbi:MULTISPECIES: sulfite exporter TauE/SafE family protein [unclassified Arthrobacter]|uniref:sulfite exporter TauE/SafE family protein n=1 Tax=Arthrobacter sp. Bz4 TaxID=2171979 RepID=UPI0004041EEA|nr:MULTISPECIES: sulfite exporter TauE/SafE family protein [unclassified Arthrobacter]
MATGIFFIVLFSILLGAIAQRIAGLGFALLIAPFLVIILGPHEGVVLVNICGVVSSALIVGRVWKDIDWSMFRWMVIPSVFGSIPGSIAAVMLPSAPLSVTVGGVVLVALSVSLVLQRSSVVVRGNAPKAVAGLTAGLTNAMAGVGGPAVSAYALLSRWPQRPFAATLQPFFVVIGLITLAVKLSLDPTDAPALQWWMWSAIGVVIVVGIFAGEKLSRFIKDDHARLFVIVIAFFGATAALVKGLLDLLL